MSITHFLDRLPTDTGSSYYVWGTGNTASLYREGLQRENWLKIHGYTDNNKALWGGEFNHKPVLPPDLIMSQKDAVFLICSPQKSIYRALAAQIDAMQKRYIHIDELILGMHKTEVMKVYDLFDDDRSRNVYLDYLQRRVRCEDADFRFVDADNHYMPADLPAFRMLNEKEIFVDCGAYVGDSIEDYIYKHLGVFGGIIGFEPDNKNYAAAQQRISRLQREWNLQQDSIQLYPYGIGDICQEYSVIQDEKQGGLGSHLENVSSAIPGMTVNVITLDSFFKSGDKPYSFLKADIESYEYRMLKGAEKSIRKLHPKLAISIYHNATDLYSIPLLIKEINPDYHMAVRWHSYNSSELVLYAWSSI